MAATAHDHPPGLEAPLLRRPRLEAVAGHSETMRGSEPAGDTAAVAEALVWRAAMAGAAIGFTLVAVVIATAVALSGIHPGSAVGIGVFVGTFSGGGFGFMTGAVVRLARQADASRLPTHEHLESEP